MPAGDAMVSAQRAIDILYSLTELKRFTAGRLTPITTRGSVGQPTAVLEITTAKHCCCILPLEARGREPCRPVGLCFVERWTTP